MVEDQQEPRRRWGGAMPRCERVRAAGCRVCACDRALHAPDMPVDAGGLRALQGALTGRARTSQVTARPRHQQHTVRQP